MAGYSTDTDLSKPRGHKEGISPLGRAAAAGDVKLTRYLLSQGYMPQLVDREGWAPVHLCVNANRLRVLRLFLSQNRGNNFTANILNWEYESPIIVAARAKKTSINIFRALLEAGANPNTARIDGLTALHFLCKRKGTYKYVKYLAENGAYINVHEYVHGQTPLHCAIREARDIKLVRYLVDHGDPNLHDFDHETPLCKACIYSFTSAAQYILSRDTSTVNIIPRSMFGPLAAASRNNNIRIVRMLLKAGANPGTKGVADFRKRALRRYRYLPIHASILVSADIFKLFLKRMNPAILLRYEKETPCNSLPIFTMMYAPSEVFFEVLMEHTFPSGFDDVKHIDFTKLADFILQTQDYTQSGVAKRFKLFFKYCSNFEPEKVFEYFVDLVTGSRHRLIKKYQIFEVLADMGISSAHAFQAKCTLIPLLYQASESHIRTERFLEIITALKPPVLALKKLSRVIVRRTIWKRTGSDLKAYTLIKNSHLPQTIKDFLWYQTQY